MSPTKNVVAIGASRNIGYYASLQFLAAGANVTFLLRNTSIFDNDAEIQKHVKSGKAILLQGDALVAADVQRAWDEGAKNGPVDLLLFTVGGHPSFHPFKGAVINPTNLVTQSLLNVLATMPTTTPAPRLITLSSTGLTKTSHASLPFALKPLYGYLLAVPHADKAGSERAVFHAAGWEWNPADDEPSEELMGSEWRERLDRRFKDAPLKRVLVIRPSMLTDGECVAEKNLKGQAAKAPYRVSEGELGGWTVSRRDVAHFVVDAVQNRWDEYEGKIVNISY
ncbi:hypothetical protein AX16_007018 [Volvariella volvacea WC 439]|nr:hypothetical protein AX16_007018 [Volvariella volvacea WC 439]